MSALPPVFVEFLGKATGFHATARGVKTELAAVEREGAGNMRKLGAISKAALLGIGVAAGIAAVKTVHMAADFQTQMTRVRTGAGEAASGMAMASKGVLDMAGQVGQSTQQLTSGLYMVESAGFHAANGGLDILRTAAMGAKVGAADLGTVTDALTTALNAYHLTAKDAVPTMNALVATEAEGKTNMEALAGSMAGILPVAASAHVGLNEVLGAMATMTAQGTSANVAATYLRQTIGQLSNPSAKAATTMKGLGLSATEVSKNLGKNGLQSTLTMLTDAITSKMGPSGTVLISTLQKAAKHTSSYQKVLAGLSGSQKTYIGALATMVGGTKSMMGALELTGKHAKTFTKDVKGIGEHVKAGGKQVEGWTDVQKTFNQKMAEAKGSFQALGISIGTDLLPAATKFAGWLATSVGWLAKHKTVLGAFALGLTAVSIGLTAATVASWDFNASLWADPLTWIVAGIIALIAALVLLVIHWRDVWNWIKSASGATVNWVIAAWHWLANGTVSIWHSISSAVVGAWHSVANFFVSAWHWVTDPIVAGWHWLQRTTMSVWNAIAGFFKKWWPLLLAIFSPPIFILLALWNHFHSAVFSAAKTVWNAISAFFGAVWSVITSAASAAWGLFKAYVIAPNVAVWKYLVGLWNKAAGWLGQQWTGIKVVASALWKSIKSAIINPIVSAWKSVTDTVGKISAAVKHGLQDAWNHVKDIGSQFAKIGGFIVDGIVSGVKNSGSSLLKAMSNMADSALKAAKSALNINSPSKKFIAIGLSIGEGLVHGIDGSTASVRAATTRVANALYRQFGSGGHKKLQRLVRHDGDQLMKLAKQRDAVTTRLKAATKKLSNLQKDWKTVRDDVASSIMSGVSVVTQSTQEGATLSAADVINNMSNQVQAALKFSANIDKLKKMGLNSALIQQIAASGVDQGGATAAALANATQGQVKQLNGMQKTLKKSAKKTGADVADAMYKAGINSAKGLVKGLKSQEKAIEKQMEKIGKAMAKAIKKELGIHSPSRVFHEIGTFVASGLANGIDEGASLATGAAGRMLGSVATPKLQGGRGAAVVHNHVHVEVHGSVRSDRDLRDVVQQEMLRLGGRNSTTYKNFKR